jgi:nitrite reductase (NO-forming)
MHHLGVSTTSGAPGGPFRPLRPVAALAIGYAMAALVWVGAGASLPGGRWFAVHLFTLGVITNLVLALSDHFARTLTHAPGDTPRWQPVGANTGILAVLWGIPNANDVAVAAGATVLTVVVFASYLRLRRMRRAALAPRFGWIVRMYERAHGAFLHGAVLGALVGTGVVSGRWWGSARLAHLHVNLLGWGGLTLLATIVFFGPTIARTRIEDGADARAASAVRVAAVTLTVAVLALLATGFDGGLGTAFRLVAAAALAPYAWATAVVCAPVRREMRGSKPSAGRWTVYATATWFPLVAWADVLLVASNELRYLDALGLALLVGVLGQAIVSSLAYLAPMLRPMGAARDRVRERLELAGPARALAWNTGVAAIVAAAAADAPALGAVLARAGWALVLATLLVQASLAASAWRRHDDAV